MFEELYINSGTILVPTGEYDSMAGTGSTYQEYEVIYFSRDKSYRDNEDALQRDTLYMCKPATGVTLPNDVPANSRFRDKDNAIHDIAIAERLFNHFEQVLEAYRLTVAKG